jgi:hypothetical protein
MIRLLVIFSFIFALFSILPSTGFHPNCHAAQKTAVNKPDRTEILSVFKKAIDLNEDFKNTVHTIPLKEHQKKRMELEKFDEEVLDAKIEDCVKILSTGRDTELAVEFFRLLISYENSADEGLSYALGKIFLNNPDLITETFNKFKKSDQQYLYKTLEWGWRNVIYGQSKSEISLQDRSKQLNDLRFRIMQLISVPQTEISKQEDPLINIGSTITSTVNGGKPKKSEWYYDPLVLVLLSGSIAAFLTLLINIIYHARIRKKTRRSLILAFASELVFAFHRCIVYYRQQFTERLKNIEVSYSELFEFADASMLSNFSTVGPKPELIAAIVFLKARYFQISRHVREAAKFAGESRRAGCEEERTRILSNAIGARGTALAFFLADYNPDLYKAIEDKTEMIINEAKKIKSMWFFLGIHSDMEGVAIYLSSVFNRAKDVKSKLDKLKKTKMSSKQLGDELEKLGKELDMCLIPKFSNGK